MDNTELSTLQRIHSAAMEEFLERISSQHPCGIL